MERTMVGKTALVTGAVRGIGRQIASHLWHSLVSRAAAEVLTMASGHHV